MFHCTDKTGRNAIRSQVAWVFKADQPKDPGRPKGAYFTDIAPSPANLRVLFKKLRVPREKQEYLFEFAGTDGLSQLNEGTGRDRRIFFSPVDYSVMRDRQLYEGPTEGWSDRQK
jgi:hypothetical protein